MIGESDKICAHFTTCWNSCITEAAPHQPTPRGGTWDTQVQIKSDSLAHLIHPFFLVFLITTLRENDCLNGLGFKLQISLTLFFGKFFAFLNLQRLKQTLRRQSASFIWVFQHLWPNLKQRQDTGRAIGQEVCYSSHCKQIPWRTVARAEHTVLFRSEWACDQPTRGSEWGSKMQRAASLKGLEAVCLRKYVSGIQAEGMSYHMEEIEGKH